MDINFENDWETDKRIGKFGWLSNWEIQSIREYRSKKGIKVHVVFRHIGVKPGTLGFGIK